MERSPSLSPYLENPCNIKEEDARSHTVQRQQREPMTSADSPSSSTVGCVGGTWHTSIHLCFCTKHLVQHLAQYLSALIMLNEWMSLPYLDFPITSYSTLFSTKWLHLTVVDLAVFCRSEGQGFSSLLMRHSVPTLSAEAERVGLHSQSLGICEFRVKLRNGSFPSCQEMLGTVV